MALAYGLDIADLPDGWTPLEAVVILTCLDAEGNNTALLRFTEGVTSWEAIGLLEVAKHETMRDNEWTDD